MSVAPDKQPVPLIITIPLTGGGVIEITNHEGYAAMKVGRGHRSATVLLTGREVTAICNAIEEAYEFA